jgi:hypothetical protein
MRRMILSLLLAGLALATGCTEPGAPAGSGEPDAGAEPLATEKTRGPVTVRLEVEPAKPSLSDEIRLTVIIRAEDGVTVERPSIRPSVAEFVVRDFKDELPAVEGGVEVRRSRYVLEALRSGAHLIRPVTVKFEVAGGGEGEPGKEYEVATDPLEIEVGSVVGEERPDLANLRGPRGPLGIEAPPTRIPWFWLALGGTVLALAVSGVYLWHRRRRIAPERRLTPEELAYLELQALVEADFLAAGRFGAFYVELTGIVRRYIERTTGVDAPDLTTEEFLREMHERAMFDGERQARLASFLEAADLIKFAARVPGQEEIERSFDTARSFVGLDAARGRAA